jgi:Arc/MetJ-type ribon-helix-helix transcriptional regulator
MTIELKPEQEQLIGRLIENGRFSTAEEAITAGLDIIQAEEEWKTYAQRRIDAGVNAAAQDDFASEQAVDELFSRFERKSA